MSLMKAENRDRWQGGRARLSRRMAVDRGAEGGRAGARLQPLLDLGGNIYFLAKVFSTDGLSFASRRCRR
ncbi:MAG: hypothetical protein P0Y64_09660 [Candidatus Sphingomonas colombiensis]|nr:hypothetical protein [Sphingomonas sp.]WEK41688.1 MAG: hypothetical protein P0Y64_09660 [Sphingomonas sp.]